MIICIVGSNLVYLFNHFVVWSRDISLEQSRPHRTKEDVYCKLYYNF